MWRGVLVFIGLTSACGGNVVPGNPGTKDAAPSNPACVTTSPNEPPGLLSCTGLYTDIASKQLALNVREYAPAVQLWSDGADKRRWIALPIGQKIDATDRHEWKFPIGTKFWKEFGVAGKRVETRLWQKQLENYWVPTAYVWNAAETEATLFTGGDINGPTGPYHVPLREECEDCHRGRTERILGFEHVSLGLEGATGLTLAELVSEGLVVPAPARVALRIGDDGTGAAVEAMGWLHANCGTTCHNGNSNAKAYGAKMRLRLDPELLDGRSSAEFEPLTTTVNVTVNAVAWFGQTRIVPGEPERSLLVNLISNRRTDNPASNQMPPIASRVVDEVNVEKVVRWIRSMPRGGDAGVPDSGVVPDAGGMGPPPDTGTDAGTASDAPANDATSTDSAADAGPDVATDAGAG
jgi:hypothetical protein